MADVATLRIQVDAARARREVREFGEAAERTERQASRLEKAAVALGISFGAFQMMQWAREAIALGDAWTNMNARLSLVTRGSEDLARAQRQLFEVAQGTRAPLEATAQLYERFARNQAALGVTSQQLIDVTETVNQTLAISGASAASSQAALVQLGQAMASGVLRGEELNSVLEQAPRLAQAIADGMGVSVGQLRAFGEQGKLTADSVVQALLDQRDVIDREFGGMALTVSGAWTQLRNATLKTVGEIDAAHGGTRNLAAAISGLANNLDELVNAATHLVALGLLRWAADGVQGLRNLGRGFAMARAETAAYAEARVREAAATRQAAAAERERLAARVASLQADRAAIQLSQQEYMQRIQTANARMARAVDPASVAVLGGAVVAREQAQQAKALQERSTAMRELAMLGGQQANVNRALAQTEAALAGATAAATNAQRAHAAAIAQTTLVARAGTAAMGMLRGALAFLGGWPGLIMIAAYAGYTAITHFREKGVRAMREEAEQAQRTMEEFKGSLEGLGSAELQAKLRETQDQIAKLQPETFASFQQGTPTAEQNRALQEYLALYERLEHIQQALVPVQKRESDEAAERARRFGELTASRTLEIERQEALNRAHGQSERQLALLNIEYDRRAERAKNASDRTADETAQLNRLTDRMAAARREAERLAEAERQRAQLGEVRAQGAGEIREAQMQLAMVEMSAEAQARYRVEMERNLRVGEAQATLTGAALEQRLRDIQTWHDLQQATAAANRALRERNQLLAAVKTQVDAGVQAARDAVGDAVRWSERSKQEAIDEAKRLARRMHETLSDGLKGVFTDGLKGFRDFFDRVRDMFLGLVADLLAQAMLKRVAAAVVGLMGNLIPKEVRAQIPNAADGAFGMSPKTLGHVGAGIGGAMVGYGLGQMTANPFAGAGAGAMGGAMTGFMIAGPMGAAIGGLAGAMTGLIGGLTGASEATKRAREAQEAYRDTIDAMEAALRGDDVAAGIARIRLEMDALRRQLSESGLGGPVWKRGEQTGAYQQELERINTLEAERIRQLQEEYETMLRQTGEDLAVRALVAQGRDDEAARLRLQIQHQRELDELVKSIDADGTRTAAEEALLAQMLYTQELERTAQAMAGVNAQAANLPATFKMAGYAFDAMQELTTDAYRRAVLGGGGSSPYPSAPPTAPAAPVPPAADAAGSGGTVTLSADHPIVLTLDGKVLARSTLREFVRGAAGPGKEQTAAILGDIRVS